ncbi:hypothetical protein CBM2589_B30259 [Cupriavidus taiwanensis]|uniref:Uncharacterized protein n=1 Tax=Cupriavidus taiwanensis TaxID=164546 RepID=A0A975X437_9BURK|nr:hypothetical protein CBM2589_B30259 [Cupriavidus taiwanensis]
MIVVIRSFARVVSLGTGSGSPAGRQANAGAGCGATRPLPEPTGAPVWSGIIRGNPGCSCRLLPVSFPVIEGFHFRSAPAPHPHAYLRQVPVWQLFPTTRAWTS